MLFDFWNLQAIDTLRGNGPSSLKIDKEWEVQSCNGHEPVHRTTLNQTIKLTTLEFYSQVLEMDCWNWQKKTKNRWKNQDHSSYKRIKQRRKKKKKNQPSKSNQELLS